MVLIYLLVYREFQLLKEARRRKDVRKILEATYRSEPHIGISYENKITTHDWLRYITSVLAAKERRKYLNRWVFFTVSGILLYLLLEIMNEILIRQVQPDYRILIVFTYLLFLWLYSRITNIKLETDIDKLEFAADQIFQQRLQTPDLIISRYKYRQEQRLRR